MQETTMIPYLKPVLICSESQLDDGSCEMQKFISQSSYKII
jgi:hypothetical protein